MRDRCKTLAFLTQFHLQYASARSVSEEKPCFLLITNSIKNYLIAMRDRFKKVVSFELIFSYISLQATLLEKKSLVFLLITNSIKNIGRDARPL